MLHTCTTTLVTLFLYVFTLFIDRFIDAMADNLSKQIMCADGDTGNSMFLCLCLGLCHSIFSARAAEKVFCTLEKPFTLCEFQQLLVALRKIRGAVENTLWDKVQFLGVLG